MTKRKNNPDWTDNIISYYNSGVPGLCPFCGSPNVKAQIIESGRRSLNFHCSSCGKSAHVDGCIESEK